MTVWLDWSIYNNWNLPNGITICQSRFKNCQILVYAFKNYPQTCAIFPKWWNFSKSGHTASDVIFMTEEHLLVILQFRIYCCCNNPFYTYSSKSKWKIERRRSIALIPLELIYQDYSLPFSNNDISRPTYLYVGR